MSLNWRMWFIRIGWFWCFQTSVKYRHSTNENIRWKTRLLIMNPVKRSFPVWVEHFNFPVKGIRKFNAWTDAFPSPIIGQKEWKIKNSAETGLASKINLKRTFPVSNLSVQFLVKLPGKGCRPKKVAFLRTSFPLKISWLIL